MSEGRAPAMRDKAMAVWRAAGPWMPYALTAVVILWLLLWGEKAWMTNDDVRMSMTVGGYGIAATPSPALVVETNVIWGWLLEHMPNVAHIRGYTLGMYAILIGCCLVSGLVLHRLKVPRWFAAAALILMYARVILYPQFTLVSGYLAVTGFLLVLASEPNNLRASLLGASLCLLLSGLVRPDELALVFLVAAPFLLHAWLRHDRSWRLHWSAAAAMCILLLSGAFVFNLHYSSTGAWAPFADIERLAGQFTDYNLGKYFKTHPDELAAAHLTLNDIKLVRAWFFLDPTVFNSGNFAPLVHAVTLPDRYAMNAERTAALLKVFWSPQLIGMLALCLLFAALDWRRLWPEATSLALLLAVMVALQVMGRPGVERIYLPAVAAMMLLSLVKLGPRDAGWISWLGIAMTVLALGFTWQLYQESGRSAQYADAIRQRTCKLLPPHRLLVVWSASDDFRWKDLYRPTTRDDDACNPPLYSIGSYQLAPPSLERLYAYTGGKNFIEALLAGQSFDIATGRGKLAMLNRYLHQHYHAQLRWRLVSGGEHIQFFRIRAVAIPQAGPPTPAAIKGL